MLLRQRARGDSKNAHFSVNRKLLPQKFPVWIGPVPQLAYVLCIRYTNWSLRREGAAEMLALALLQARAGRPLGVEKRLVARLVMVLPLPGRSCWLWKSSGRLRFWPSVVSLLRLTRRMLARAGRERE